MAGPFGDRDRAETEQLIQTVGEVRSAFDDLSHAARMVSEIGDIRRARRLVSRIAERSTNSLQMDSLCGVQAQVDCSAGRMYDAVYYFQQSARATNPDVAPRCAVCWIEMGELDTAKRIVDEFVLERESIYVLRRHLVIGVLALAKGEVEVAAGRANIGIRLSADFGFDGVHLSASELFAEIVVGAYDAGLLNVDALKDIAAEVERAQGASLDITGSSPPPWYSIRFLGYRASILIRGPQHTEALTLDRRALALARTTCEDLIPETGRTLADHLLRTGNPDEALPLLAEIEPEAISRGMLKELARIRAARVLALVLRNEPSSAIEPAMAALREALESTGAPRIKAETLLELAIRLPPATTLPDPLALASETHTLFVEMPMPAKEARSLELAGDVLAARGQLADARRRYLTARAILDRRGLELRLPALTTKLDRLT